MSTSGIEQKTTSGVDTMHMSEHLEDASASSAPREWLAMSEPTPARTSPPLRGLVMGKRATPVLAPTPLAKRVRALVFERGIAAASEELGVGREQTICIAGRLPTSPSAIELAEQQLGQRAA